MADTEKIPPPPEATIAAPKVAEATVPSAEISPGRGRQIGGFLLRLGPVWALVALAILGTVLNEDFLSPANVSNVLTRSAIVGLVAIGATFVLSAGMIDLSVGSLAALIAGAMILSMNEFSSSISSFPLLLTVGVAIALGLGALGGALNGLIITRGKVDSFIVTLGTMGIFRSVITYVQDGGAATLKSGLREQMRPLYYGSFLGISAPVWTLIVLTLVAIVVMHKTRLGRYALAIGSNREVARYSGIKTDRVSLLVFILQGLCVGLATIIYVPRLGAASITTGAGWELEAITAVVVGGTALRGGHACVSGTVAGIVMLSLVGNILNLTSNLSNLLNGAIQGAIIIAAVLLQRRTRT
ncbi:MAG TPA: ABC transporter permease [Chthoniobacterales bacterium]